MNMDTVQGFYRAALIGLRCLDAAQERASRFGPGPDAGWNGFRGHLGAADRIDLLCRDAAVKWQAAFSPARVFGLSGLAPDEPFGPNWQGLDDHQQATALWREVETLEEFAAAASLRRISAALELPPLSSSPSATWAASLHGMTGHTQALVGGAAAILALAHIIAKRDDLRWSQQVTVVAERPAVRQLAGLVAPVLGAGAATRLVRVEDMSELQDVFDIRVASDDADPLVVDAIAARDT